MKLARLSLSAAFCAASLAAMAVPTALIVQSKVPLRDKVNPNVDLAQYVAQELDASGRLTPVLYSKSDAAYGAAVAARKVKDAAENPRARDITDTARRLGAEYILIVEGVRNGKSVHGKATLYRNRREVWKDDQTLSVSTSDSLDSTDTARSLARTFVFKMNFGPLKGLPERPKTAPPVIQPGQEPVVEQVRTGTSGIVPDDRLKRNLDALVHADKMDNAILMMRDAVDAAPMDVQRRLELIDLLQTANPTAAAEEARRAAELMPERVELRVLAARCWIKAGHSAEAQKDLNEAVARDPNAAATRLLLGELSLEQLEPVQALPHLDAVIKEQDSAQARFLRALCRCLLGGSDGLQADLAQMDKLSPSPAPEEISRRYATAADVTDRALTQDGARVRSLIAEIVVKPKDKELKDQVEQISRLLLSRTALLGAVSVPADRKAANEKRILAHKLLAQSLSDIESYSTSPDDDTLADARTTLGEALKTLGSLKN